MIRLLNKRINAFMGLTHTVLSLCLMAILMMVPTEFFQSTFGVLKHNLVLFFVCVIVLVGGALLPDLDNDQSSAGHSLGIIGSLFTLFMKSTSAIIWTVYHGKGDRPPRDRDGKPTQHRYLWHTLIVGIIFIALFYFFIPNTNETLYETVKSVRSITEFFKINSIILLYMLVIFAAVLAGSSMVVYRISQLFKLIFHMPAFVKYVVPVAVICYIATINYTDMRIIGLCFGVGYLAHCVEDMFANSGVCALWPIPVGNQVWKKIHFPLAVDTGGSAETIITILGTVGAVLLFFFVFTNKTIF